MSEKENIQLAEQAIAAVNAHDLDGYVNLIDYSYIGESETAPGPILGPEGARQNMNLMLTAFPDVRLDIEQILASGDHVMVRARVSGTHRGTFAGVAPTNKSVSWGVCTVVEVRNGKVIRGRTYGENLNLLRRLGVLSLPKAATAQ
ncbi:MAG TPA: ester cyclase [Bryobacteraceae bacterium]|nr:ester cyclase [Bryobacteraceae bacterium]